MEEEVIKLREKGYGYKKIAKQLGITRDKARYYCLKNSLGGDKCNSTLKNAAEKPQKRIYKKPKVQPTERICPECKKIFFAKGNRIYCSDECKRTVNRRKEKERGRIRIYERKPIPQKYCECCGKLFVGTKSTQKFCSKKCCRQFHGVGRKYQVPRDKRLVECTKVDKSVWLMPLIKRDKNICAICGKECNLYDYEMTASGAMIVGDTYPTIDHIYPLSKGGQHIWSNVQLAHMSCNRKKRDEVEI